MSDDNKDIVQSFLWTTAKYEFSLMEKRILYRQIEIEQALLTKNCLRDKVSIDTSEWGNRRYRIPKNFLLKQGEKDKNHSQVEDAFKRLLKKIVTIKTPKYSMGFGVIQEYKIEEDGFVSWVAHPKVVQATMDFAKGHRKYELKTIMDFDSVYSMRMYELMSQQKSKLSLSLSTFREMFDLKNKYKQRTDLEKRVLSPAQKELDEKSPYSFEYEFVKEGRRLVGIDFYPKYIPNNRDENLEQQELQKQIHLSWDFTNEEKAYLVDTFGFTKKEIDNNIDTFKEFKAKGHNLLEVLTNAKRRILDAKKPKGYLIGVLQTALKTEQKTLY